MKKIFILIISISLTLSAFGNNFKFTYFENYPPLSWNEKGEVKGILIDILDEIIITRMGLSVEHHSYPWKRAQLMVKDGKADGFITIPTEERLGYTVINSEPVYVAKFTIFTNIKNNNIQKISKISKLDEIKNFRVIHYLGSGWANEALGNYNIRWVKDLDETLLLLALNRVDIFIDPSDIINYNINEKSYNDRIVEIKNTLDSSNFMLCIGFKSNFRPHMNEFDLHLKNMKEDGTMEKIILKYR